MFRSSILIRFLPVVFLAGVGTPVGQCGLEDARSEDLLDELSERTFRWFWDLATPDRGLVPVRAPDPPSSSVAGIGFGLTAYGIGADRGYVTREAAAARTLKTLKTLWESPQGEIGPDVAGLRGFFLHYLDLDNGLRFRRAELSTMDTALLMAGVLFAQSFFDRTAPEEIEIRAYADSLYRRVQWPWFQREHAPLLTMSLRPERGGFSRFAYQGLNEAMILYILALGSPTHPIGNEAWDSYASTYLWGAFYGYEHVQFSPLFGHQFSHVWIDFRGIADEYMRSKDIDYFENSRRATLAQRAYAIDNPGAYTGYGRDMWGLSACDGPARTRRVVDDDTLEFRGYWARGVSLRGIRDDGTITPAAAAGSIPFVPAEAVSALLQMRDRYGSLIYNQYGFVDAFNPTFTFGDEVVGHGAVHAELGWFDDQQLAINQGPIVAMIENHHSELIWRTMKKNPYVVRGLCRAGFRGGWLEGQCA